MPKRRLCDKIQYRCHKQDYYKSAQVWLQKQKYPDNSEHYQKRQECFGKKTAGSF